MSEIQINIHHPRVTASFAIEPGQTVALFGRSGAGKSTLLKCVAGLLRAPESEIKVGSVIWQDTSQGMKHNTFIPTHLRKIAVIFQDHNLFPHLNVQKNLVFGCSPRNQQIFNLDINRVVEQMGLRSLLDRKPSQLSGGEKQRVALARVLLQKPRLLLMDEPFSSLDTMSKIEIFPYLETLKKEQHLPILYVSHSVDEVLRFADSVVILESGKVTKSGSIAELTPHLQSLNTALRASVYLGVSQ
jgi:molybdate transport system ATP-binding protein